jgi:hypothetical protein
MAEAVLLGASIGLGAYSAEQQTELADQESNLEQQSIRNQQVSLRLQATQQSIQQMRHLQQVIATTTVDMGVRGIASDSGSVRAIFNHDYGQYVEDKDASLMNLQEKELGLEFNSANVDLSRHAEVQSAWMNFGKSALQSGLLYAGGKLPTGKIGAPSDESGIGAYGSLPDPDAEYTSQFDLNAE